MNRVEIMRDCPEEFEDKLRDIIDYLEGRFIDIRDTLEIKGLCDIGRIEEAYDIAKEICYDLY